MPTPKSPREVLLNHVTEMTREKGFYGLKSINEDLPFKENLTREELLCIEIMMGNTDNVRQYLQLGADANYKVKNKSLLDLAGAYGHEDIVQVLKDFGAKQPKKNSNRPK